MYDTIYDNPQAVKSAPEHIEMAKAMAGQMCDFPTEMTLEMIQLIIEQVGIELKTRVEKVQISADQARGELRRFGEIVGRIPAEAEPMNTHQ